MKVAICQLAVTENKQDNISRAYSMLNEAALKHADISILPEMFCIKYKTSLFEAAAERIPNGESYSMLQTAAKELNMTVIGGSVPEKSHCGRLYNTCMCFSAEGEFIGKYRKAHLFDVDFEGFRFKESDTFSPGNNKPLIIDSPIKTGVSICFDIRFPEWSAYVRKNGADMLALPAAFSVKTGRKHWELLLRARALDNQIFVAGVAPAASDSSYGHSMIASPSGEVLIDMGEAEGMEVVDLPMHELQRMRREIPILPTTRS